MIKSSCGTRSKKRGTKGRFANSIGRWRRTCAAPPSAMGFAKGSTHRGTEGDDKRLVFYCSRVLVAKQCPPSGGKMENILTAIVIVLASACDPLLMLFYGVAAD